MPTNSVPKSILWSAPAIALLAVISAIVINWAESSRSEIPVIAVLPHFALIERDGDAVTRDSLNGRIHIVNFMFTRCPGICPRMTNTIGELYELYRPSDKVRFLSISVDPDYDTPDILKRYADSVGVDDHRWSFARGPISEVQTLIEKGFLLDASELPAGHPARLVLVDQFGQIRGYYSYDDESQLQLLRQHVRQLAREM